MTTDTRSPLSFLGPSLPPTVVVVLAGLALFTGGRGSSSAPPQVATIPVVAATPAAPAPPVVPPPATITTAWLDAQVAGSRTARLIDDYLADMGCLAAATALRTDTVRGPAAALAAVGERVPCRLGAVIVSLSAYEDSNSRWQADRTLATIQSAVSAANYTLERFHLPRAGSGTAAATDTDPDARRGPGVLLFRRTAGTPGARLRQAHAADDEGHVEVLAVLTVPEMPTSGIERVPLLLASHLALALHALPHPDGPSHAAELRVVGPFYSGSSLSLLRGLEEMAWLEGESPDRQGLQVQVISGSATSWSNCDVLSGALAHDGQITFERTVHQDETLLLALQDHLAAIRPEWAHGEGVALLVESSTGWGTGLGQAPAGSLGDGGAPVTPLRGVSDGSPCGESATAPRPTVFEHALRLGFPLHIADRYASRQRSVAAPAEFSKLVATAEVLRLEDSITPSDRLPTFTPSLTDAARDLTLEGILSQLQRRRIGAIGILSTDERDRLFLAREINRVSPDVILFGTEPDILMLHPEYAPFVRGMLMASSYPMQGHAQTLTHGDGMHGRRTQFTSMAQQGVYNALLLALGDSSEAGPLLVDYRAPDGSEASGAATQCADEAGVERPVPWVLVVGQREFTPFSARAQLISPQDCAVVRGRVRTVGDVDEERYLFASDQEFLMWLLLPVTAVVLMGLVVAAQRRPLPSARWLSPPALLRRLEGASPVAAAGTRRGARRHGEEASHAAEHAILTVGLLLALGIFTVWQVHLWHDVSLSSAPDLTASTDASTLVRFWRSWHALSWGAWRMSPAMYLTSWTLTALATLGAIVLVALGGWRLWIVSRGRAARRASWRVVVRRSLAACAPELVSVIVLLIGAAFVVAELGFLWRQTPGGAADRLFASSRAFDLSNLLSPAPLLTMFPVMIVAWIAWSLRTLYYQRISPTCALPLVHALVSRDARDRRLEMALVSTLGTTMQPAGVFLLVPVAVLLLIWLLLEPRMASVEGAAYGAVVLLGTTLGAVAAALELGQAAWLARRVTRLLERVRIHPIAADVEAMEQEPFDWRPALRPTRSPERLLRRALEAAGEVPPVDTVIVATHDRVPVLRTETWRLALQRAGQWLRPGMTSGVPLTVAQRRLSAMVISLLLQSLVTRVVRGFGIAVLLSMLLLVGHLLTAFSGRSLALLVDVGLIVVAAALAIRALLTLERDHVLSRLWHGTPGSLNWNSGLVWRAVIYAGLPLLTIISMRFPEVGGQLITVVEPLRHLMPTP